VVTNVKKDEIITIYGLFLGEEEWKDVFRNEGETENFLLNSRVGRLLMVLE
jgi:ABC-type enterochelin transport system permease subunit